MFSARRLLTLTLAITASAFAQTGPDTAGLRLGMDEAQVTAALKVIDPAMQLRRTLSHYTYRDGVQGHKTPEYLSLITAQSPAQGEQVFVLFSSAPGPQKVISITRTVQLENPPTAAQLEQQLAQKYGTPTTRSQVRQPPRTSIVWGQPGKATCWRGTPNTTSFAAASIGNGTMVEHLQRGQQRGHVPRDIALCGYAVGAQLEGEPVRALVTRLTDFAGWAASDVQAGAWVEGLRQKAEKERQARGSGPKL